MHPANVPDLRARELLTVVTLAEYGSFVAAAAHLKTSQPALTRTVKRVERILGVTLFARNTRRVEITAAGREFIALAERMLNDLQLTVRSIGEVTAEQRGRVTISTYSAYSAHAIPQIVHRYQQTRPLVEVRIREGRQPDILEDVRSGAADFGIGYVANLPDVMEGVLLRVEPLYALIPHSHRLASRKRTKIKLAELRHERLISPPIDSHLRRLVDGAATAAGFTLQYGVVVDRLLSATNHVAAGVGIAVLPSDCLARAGGSDPFEAALLTEPSLSVSVGLITLRGRYMTPAAAGMISEIREVEQKQKS